MQTRFTICRNSYYIICCGDGYSLLRSRKIPTGQQRVAQEVDQRATSSRARTKRKKGTGHARGAQGTRAGNRGCTASSRINNAICRLALTRLSAARWSGRATVERRRRLRWHQADGSGGSAPYAIARTASSVVVAGGGGGDDGRVLPPERRATIKLEFLGVEFLRKKNGYGHQGTATLVREGTQ